MKKINIWELQIREKKVIQKYVSVMSNCDSILLLAMVKWVKFKNIAAKVSQTSLTAVTHASCHGSLILNTVTICRWCVKEEINISMNLMWHFHDFGCRTKKKQLVSRLLCNVKGYPGLKKYLFQQQFGKFNMKY